MPGAPDLRGSRLSDAPLQRELAWMQRALALSERALGRTAPEPPAGAVLVAGDEGIGEGVAGREPAELVALADCASRGRESAGAVLVTTLEPSAIDAILAAGIGRVVVGALDPRPELRGRGLARLRAAGVEGIAGVARGEAERRMLGFARAVRSGLPEVTLKAGASADGRIATASGESRWITSAASREAGHRLRDAHDAVLVGIGTALADDPALTTRLPDGSGQNAVPVVLDTDLRLPATARLLTAGRRAVVVCAEDAPDRPLEADIVRVPRGPDGRTDPEAALRALAARGLHRVMVEGGGVLHRALLDRGLADTLELFLAPVLIPGGRPFVAGPPIGTLADALPMTLAAISTSGPDVRLTWHLRHALAPDPHADGQTS